MTSTQALQDAALAIEWDLFQRIIGAVFSPAWLAGASALLSQNDTDES